MSRERFLPNEPVLFVLVLILVLDLCGSWSQQLRRSETNLSMNDRNLPLSFPPPSTLDVGRSMFDVHSPDNTWLLWQLADSAFPSGGFAHSNGLEAAWQNGELKNSADLSAWLEVSLSQFGRASLPFVTAIHTPPPLNLNLSLALPLRDFLELDQLCDSFLTNHVANRASRLQGRAFLASAQRIFALPELDSLSNGSTPPSETPYFHLAPVFGIVTRALHIDRDSATRLFMFLHLRGILGAAVRLGLVGPLEAQSIQHRLGPRCESLLARLASLTLDDLAQTAPLLDLWQGTQDRLYSRLFQS